MFLQCIIVQQNVLVTIDTGMIHHLDDLFVVVTIECPVFHEAHSIASSHQVFLKTRNVNYIVTHIAESLDTVGHIVAVDPNGNLLGGFVANLGLLEQWSLIRL